jgi:hypothetical protein
LQEVDASLDVRAMHVRTVSLQLADPTGWLPDTPSSYIRDVRHEGGRNPSRGLILVMLLALITGSFV